MPLANIAGEGRIVACHLVVDSRTDKWWGEGDWYQCGLLDFVLKTLPDGHLARRAAEEEVRKAGYPDCASYLARPDARTLLVVGAGHIGSEMPDAYRAALPIERVLVWNPTPARAERLVAAAKR